MKPRYVVGLMLHRDMDALILVRKNRPEWQRGLLNGPGGKVEPGETFREAMCREWREEIGFDHCDWRSVATMDANDLRVAFYAAIIAGRVPDLPEINDVGEDVLFVARDLLGSRHDLMPNLRWLIPLAFDDPGRPFAAFDYLTDPIPSIIDATRARSA